MTDEALREATGAGAAGGEGAGAVDGKVAFAGVQVAPWASLTAASAAEALVTASAVAAAASWATASAGASALTGWEGEWGVAEGLTGVPSCDCNQAADAPMAGLLFSADSQACTSTT